MQTVQKTNISNSSQFHFSKCDIKLSTVLSTFATIFILAYYFTASDFLPLDILLLLAAQVLSRGIIELNGIFLNYLGQYAQKHKVRLDVLTNSIVAVDTRTGPIFSWPYLFLGGFTSLFLINTPEVLLGSLGARSMDIREVSTSFDMVEVASFGGGFDDGLYYTSGLLLMASKSPQEAYGEVAARYRRDLWVIPRKPTVWYQRFAEINARQNDRESRIFVPTNQVAVLQKWSADTDFVDRCRSFYKSDFKYKFTMYICEGGKFGFEASDPNSRAERQFFRLSKGMASVHYSSLEGYRRISIEEVFAEQEVEMPRFEDLWDDMSSCFLNTFSFNKVNGPMTVPERLAISSIVRIAGLDSKSGFSSPPAFTEAEVTSVKISHLSRWVPIIMVASLTMIYVATVFWTFRTRILSSEIGQWIQIGEGLSSKGMFSSFPRSAQKEKKKGAKRIDVIFKTVVHGDVPQLTLEPVSQQLTNDGGEDAADVVSKASSVILSSTVAAMSGGGEE